MNYRRKLHIFILTAALAISLPACASSDVQEAAAKEELVVSGTLSLLNSEEMFTDRDKEIGYDENTSVIISLADNASACDSAAVSIEGNIITITEEGTYLISGSLTDGQVIVDTDDTEKVQLVLDGITVNCKTSAAIYVRQADKVFLTLAPDTENILCSSGEFIAIDDNNIDGAIFSKADLTLNGTGTLTVESAYGHGIVSKDDLKITGGTYQITAASSALSGKDSVRIADGTFTLSSQKDGIHSENEDDSEKGFIYIADGAFTITCGGDGLDASSILQVEGGTFDITSGGGNANAAQKTQKMQTVSDDTPSTKGMKSDTALFLANCTVTIDSADDALHTNGDLEIASGSFTLSTGDDGIHADGSLLINDGTISIPASYEGIEGQSITINDGEINLYASDDGLNAAGGNDQSGFGGRFGGDMGQDTFAADGNCIITINGGSLYINADGDGIDSNGDLVVNGGEIYINGPTDNNNGSLDYNGNAAVTGGIVIATGSSGMAQNFGEASTQCSMMVTLSATASAEDTVTLKDSSGNVLVTYTPEKAYNCVLISSPEITQGESYTLTAGEQASTIEMDSLIYGNGGFGGGMGGMGNPGGHGGMGGHGGRGNMDTSDDRNAPDGMTPPDGSGAPDGMTPPDGSGAPDNMTPPDGSGAPDNMTPPDGSGAPDNMTPPDGSGAPDGMTPPNGSGTTDGMTPPDGSGAPDNMTPPDGSGAPDNMTSPDSTATLSGTDHK